MNLNNLFHLAGHGDPCVTDSNCTDLDGNSACSVNDTCDSTTSCIGVCTCVEGLTHVNGSCVKMRLGDPCTSNTSCNISVANSVCMNGACECGGEYVKKPENLCSLRLLGDKCLKTEDCNATIKYSECDQVKKTCECPYSFRTVNNNTCQPVVGSRCYADETCRSVPNATCFTCTNSESCFRSCHCNDGFRVDDGSCVPLKIGDNCTSLTTDACNISISNSECKDGKCRCILGHTEKQGACLLRTIGDSCLQNVDCEAAVKNSFCNSSAGKCRCLQGFRSRNGLCEKIKIGDQCKSSPDCNKSVINRRCKDIVCICLEHYYSSTDKTQCLERLLADTCEDTDSCANVKDSVCNQTCVCRPGFKQTNRTHCTPRQLGEACSSHLDCAVACGDNICACSSGKCTKAALEGTNCSAHMDCTELFKNSSCNNTICQCNNRLAPDPAFQKCVFYNLGHDCSETKDRCGVSVESSVCFNKTCQCKDTHYPTVNKSSCRNKKIGGTQCVSNAGCKVPNSFCHMNTCKCVVGYREKGFDACAPVGLDEQCSKTEDCNTTNPHTDCDNGRCRCLPGYMLNTRTTKPTCERRTIGSRCKHASDCTLAIENSVCAQCGPNLSDTENCPSCQCNASYFANAKREYDMHVCVIKLLDR